MPRIDLHFNVRYTGENTDDENSDDESVSDSDNEDSENDEKTKPVKPVKEPRVEPDLTKITPNDMLYATIDYIEEYYNIVSMKWSSPTVITIIYTIKPECRKNDKQNKKNIFNRFMQDHSFEDVEYEGINNGWVWCDKDDREYALTSLVGIFFYTTKGKMVKL
jgi:hypothetical protein